VVEFKRWKAKRVRRNSRLVRPLMDSKPLLLAEAIAGRMPNYLDEFTKVFDMYGFVIDTITDEITLICRAIEQQAYAQGTIIYVEDEYRSGRLWNPLLKFEIGEQRRRYGGREKQGGFLLEFANTGTVKRLLYLIELRSCFIRCRNRLMQMLEHLGLWEIPRPRKAEAKLGRSRDIGNVDGSGLERWVPRRVRLGGVVRPLLELPRQTWLAGVMERRLPDYKERLRDMLRSLRAVINIIRDEIDLICENVRYQASLQGVSVRAVSRCDKGRKILTACLSRSFLRFFTDLTYVQVSVKTSGGEETVTFSFTRVKENTNANTNANKGANEGKDVAGDALRVLCRSVAEEFNGVMYKDGDWDVVYIPLEDSYRKEMKRLLKTKLGVTI